MDNPKFSLWTEYYDVSHVADLETFPSQAQIKELSGVDLNDITYRVLQAVGTVKYDYDTYMTVTKYGSSPPPYGQLDDDVDYNEQMMKTLRITSGKE